MKLLKVVTLVALTFAAALRSGEGTGPALSRPRADQPAMREQLRLPSVLAGRAYFGPDPGAQEIDHRCQAREAVPRARFTEFAALKGPRYKRFSSP